MLRPLVLLTASAVGIGCGTSSGQGDGATGGDSGWLGGSSSVGGSSAAAMGGAATAAGGNVTMGGTVGSGGATSAGGSIASTGGMSTGGSIVSTGGSSTGGTVAATGGTSTGGSIVSTGGFSTGGTVAATGGTSTGGVSTGGMSTGGTSTGGMSTGGMSTGGTSTGGTSTGGTSTGGMSTGGMSTGGMSTGGMSTGGTSTGGNTAVTTEATGYASTASNGLDTTTGGGSLTPTTVTSCDQLKSLLEDSSPQVVEIPSGTTLDCRTTLTIGQACQLQCSSGSSKTFLRVPVGDQTCTSLADFNGDGTLEVPAGTLVNVDRYDFSVNVGSNKTLRGAGSGATLLGASLVIQNQSNVIVQNLTMGEINPSLIEAGDGLTINTSHHVWIDHCAFYMISDGYMDIRYGSSAITVSYSYFNGANSYLCDGQHNFVSLVSDSQVTYNNIYFDHVGGRNPKITGDDGGATVHLYNNYYDSVSYFCASAGTGAELRVENNYYYNSRYPHWDEGGAIEAIGNVYAGSTSTDGRDSNADLNTPPYVYTLDDVNNLPSTVPDQAGPHQL